MSKFETVGSDRQYGATTRQEADIQYKKSCDLCCMSLRANHCDCDHCWIEYAHNYMIEKFARLGAAAMA